MKLNSTVRGIIYFILFMILIGVDQVTKYLATTYLKGHEPFVILKDIFEFHYLDGGNKGAAWGILSGKISFFIIITLIVCGLLVLFLMRIEKVIHKDLSLVKKMSLLQIVLVILLSGAVGNLIDRIVNGYVVDFIYFKLIEFPIFNVADCYVTVSSICLIIIAVFVISDEEFGNIFSFKTKNSKEH